MTDLETVAADAANIKKRVGNADTLFLSAFAHCPEKTCNKYGRIETCNNTNDDRQNNLYQSDNEGINRTPHDTLNTFIHQIALYNTEKVQAFPDFFDSVRL